MKSKTFIQHLACCSILSISAQTFASGNDTHQCAAQSSFAFNSMGLRQYGFNYDAFLNNINSLKSVPTDQKSEYEKIGQQAYKVDIVQSISQKQEIRHNFANQIYQACMNQKN